MLQISRQESAAIELLPTLLSTRHLLLSDSRLLNSRNELVSQTVCQQNLEQHSWEFR